MRRLYLHYNETRVGGESFSDEEWSEHKPVYVTVTFEKLSRDPPKSFFCDSILVSQETFDGDKAFLAVVFYSDGDTFGTTHGLWEKIGCYPTEDLAHKALNNINHPRKSKDSNLFKPWDGYFACHERNDIICLSIT